MQKSIKRAFLAHSRSNLSLYIYLSHSLCAFDQPTSAGNFRLKMKMFIKNFHFYINFAAAAAAAAGARAAVGQVATPNAPPYGAGTAPCGRLMYQVGVLGLSRLHWQAIGRSGRTGLCPFPKRLANARRLSQLRSCLCTDEEEHSCFTQHKLQLHIAGRQSGRGGLAAAAGWVVCASAPLDRQLQYAAMLRSCLNVCVQLLLLLLLFPLPLLELLRMSWQRDGDAVRGKTFRGWQKKLLHQLSTANCIDFYTL